MPLDRTVDESANLIDLATCLNYYRMFTPGLAVGVDTPVELGAGTVARPDLVAVVTSGPLRQCSRGPRGLFAGPPNFVADIFPVDSLQDFRERLDFYARAGVVEYVAWQVGAAWPLWNRLNGKRYAPIDCGTDQVLESVALPGFRIPRAAFEARDWAKVIAAINEGLNSDAHQAFRAGVV